MRKNRDIKFVITGKRRNYLVSEPNYHTTIEMKKTQILMNKPVYLGLSMLELSKILMYELWYDYVKYGEKAKLCYMDAHIFILYIKTDYTYKDIAEDVETRFDTSNYKLDSPLPK